MKGPHMKFRVRAQWLGSDGQQTGVASADVEANSACDVLDEALPAEWMPGEFASATITITQVVAMKVVKESVTLTMSSEESETLQHYLLTAHDHIEAYFNSKASDTEAGTPDADLMDAMHRIYDFGRKLASASYA